MTLASQKVPRKSNFRNTYPKYFRRDAHYIFAAGYRDVRSNLNADTGELEITVSIHQAIQKRFDLLAGFPDKIMKRRYAVKAEDPRFVAGGIKRMDILVETTEPDKIRIRYVFEAKRLRKNGFPVGLYCDDGIMRFVDETYAAECPEAALVGCWQDGNSDYWVAELARRFKEGTTISKMGILKNLKKTPIISQIAVEFLSMHRAKSGKTITLFHIFLDCSTL